MYIKYWNSLQTEWTTGRILNYLHWLRIEYQNSSYQQILQSNVGVRYLSSVQDWDSTSRPHQKTKMFNLAFVLSLIQIQMNIGQSINNRVALLGFQLDLQLAQISSEDGIKWFNLPKCLMVYMYHNNHVNNFKLVLICVLVLKFQYWQMIEDTNDSSTHKFIPKDERMARLFRC